MIDLRVILTMENVQYSFNTRRLIYKTFIDPQLDYEKDGMYVVNIDGDGYNCRLDNLQLVTKSEKQLRAVKRDRVMPTLKTADRTNWRKNYSTSKPVEQYDLQGNFIREFPSVRAAAREMRIEDKVIIQVAKGVYKQWNAYVWKYKQDRPNGPV